VHFKTLCTYLYFGVLGGYVWSIFGSMATGTIIAYIVIAIGIIVYIRGTKPYARAAKKANDDTMIKSNAVKRIVMLIALVATVGLGIFVGTTTAIGNAKEDAALKEQLEKQAPGSDLPVDTPYEATLKVNVKAMSQDGKGRQVTIPAGTQVTVRTYARIGGVYEAYVRYEGGGSTSYSIADLNVILPSE
jgi:heme/copper-type cytochrome/quinol oxidase subunit 2